MTSVSSIL